LASRNGETYVTGPEVGVRLDLHAGADLELRHDPRDRCVQGQRPCHVAGFEQPFDVPLRNVPELETPPSGIEQGVATGPDILERAPGRGIPVAQREQQLLLGGDEFR
jgi:hypothetical protein